MTFCIQIRPFRDKDFEATNDRFHVVFNNRNYYWNYYGSFRFMIPMGEFSYLYMQYTYAGNTIGGGSVTQSSDFILATSSVNQVVSATVDYSQSNVSHIPEIGIQTKTKIVTVQP